MCRLENISYDLEVKLGTIFMLSDSLQGGCIGILGVGRNRADCLKYACTAFNFIETQTSSKKDNFILLERDDRLSFKDINTTLKLMYRRITTKN